MRFVPSWDARMREQLALCGEESEKPVLCGLSENAKGGGVFSTRASSLCFRKTVKAFYLNTFFTPPFLKSSPHPNEKGILPPMRKGLIAP